MVPELWAAGCDLDTARFVARQLAQEGYSLVVDPLATTSVGDSESAQAIDKARAEVWSAAIKAILSLRKPGDFGVFWDSEIIAITPPADISAALDAKLDEAFRAGAEAMREAALDEVHQECWADGNGSSVAEILLVEQATTTLAMDAIRSLPIPEREKGGAE